MERLARLGLWCPEVSFFHAFHDFQGVQNRFWNQVPRACFWGPGAPFFHALRFPCCSGVHFWTLLLEPGFGVQELHFSTLSRLAFWALPTPPWKPWKAWKWWKRLARQRGRRSRADGFFCVGLSWMQQREAIRRAADAGPDHGSQRKARRFCLSGRPPPVRAFDSPERPADPRRAVLPQHHRPVLLAVRQLRDFNRGP